MNKIFKRIWNKSRGSFVAVSEVCGTGQARGNPQKAVVVGVLAALPFLAGNAVAGSYTNKTFVADGSGNSALIKEHRQAHYLYGTTIFKSYNGAHALLIVRDNREVHNYGDAWAYGYGSDKDNTTTWGIRSTWGCWANHGTDHFLGYGGKGKNSLGVGMEYADGYFETPNSTVYAEGGSGQQSWGVGVAWNRNQGFGSKGKWSMEAHGGTGQYAAGVAMFNGWDLRGIALLANTSTPNVSNSGTITADIYGGKALGAIGIAFLSEQRWVNNAAGKITVNLTGGTVSGAKAYAIYQRGSSSFTNNGTLVINNKGSGTSGVTPWNNWKFTNGGTLTLGGNFGNNIYWGQYYQNKGTLKTTLANFGTYTLGQQYNPQTLNVIGTSGATTTQSHGFAEYVVDYLKTFSPYVKFSSITGGTIHILDTVFTSSAQESVKQNLIAMGVAAGVNFTFESTAGSRLTTPQYKVANANKFLKESGHTNLLLHEITLDSEIADLTVGSASGLVNSVGFKALKGVNSLTVAKGYEFTLLGDSRTAFSGNTITVNGGTLNFGTGYLAEAGQGGTVKTLVLSDNAKLNLKAGKLTFSRLSGTGAISVAAKAALNLSSDFLLNGTYDNVGTSTLTGKLTFGDDASFTSSGNLITTLGNLFDNVTDAVPDALRYISLNSFAPVTVQESVSAFFQKYVPGNLSEAVIKHMKFTGGNVEITGVNLTQTQRDDLAAAFKKQFPNTSITFSGTVNGVSTNDVFNTATVNALAEAGIGLSNVIYVDRDLVGENQAVSVSNSGVKNSVGFRGIENATAVTVGDSLRLALIGATDATPYVMTNATVNVNRNSTLELGSLGLSEVHRGTMGEVNLSGGNTESSRAKFTAVNGIYSTGSVKATNAAIAVRDGADLTMGSLSFAEDVTLANEGKFTVKGALSGTADSLAVIDNYGDLSVEGDTTLYGSFTNHANAKAHLKDAYVNGTLTNASHAFLEANDLTVKGQLVNHGEIEASDTSSVFGVLTNNGTIRLYDTEVGNRGTINNTYTLTQTGTLTIDGKLSTAAGSVSSLDTVNLSGTATNRGSMTAKMIAVAADAALSNIGSLSVTSLDLSSDNSALSNTGTFKADVLTVAAGASVVNGTVPMRRIATYAASGATQNVDEFNLSEGASATNAGTDYFGKGTIAGTYTIAAVGSSYLGYSSEHTDDVGYTVAATGKIINDGSLSLGGTVTNAGAITGNGTLTLLKGTDGTFTNTGSIQSGTLVADNVTYTQTAGTLAADAGWFTNSVINQTGGTITSAALGSGNTYNLGADGSTDTAQYNLARLTSDSTVNIRQGATLHADVIAMTGNKMTHLLGGTLATTLDQVFNDVSHQAHDINAANPNDRVDVTGPDIVTGVGTVIDSVAKGIEFGWGTVAFDDASYSAVVAADALAKLDALDADYAGKTLEVAFNGKADKEFNVDLANTVVATKNGSATFATFVNETLTNLTAANAGATSLVVGTDANLFVPESGTPNVLNDSMGFRSIVGATDGIYVNDGRHLVLVGAEEGIDLADGKVVVGGANADGTASVLTLGSYASAKPTKGHLSDVWVDVLPSAEDQGGATAVMQVRNGSFTVDTLHNGGILRIGGDGTDLAEDHDATLLSSMIKMVGASQIINDGIVDVTQVVTEEGTGNHVIRNQTKGNFTFGMMDLNGRVLNAGTMTGQLLMLRQRGSENSGTMTVNSLSVYGDSTWGSGAQARGRFTNSGTLSFNHLDLWGDFFNEGTVTAVGSNLATIDLKTGARFENSGTATIATTTVVDGAVVINHVGAELIGDVTTSGNFENQGVIRGFDDTIAGHGIYVSGGTFTNATGASISGQMVIGVSNGTLTNSGDIDIRYGLQVTKTGQFINEGTYAESNDGYTLVDLTDKSAVGILNRATFGATNLIVKSGVVEGGTIGSVDSVGTVQADGTIRNADAVFKDLTNAGVVNVGKLTTKTSFTNSGTANLVTADVTGLVNETAGTVTVKDGTFTNAANHGTMTVTGTVAAEGTNDGKLTVADSGRFNVEAGKTFESSGTLTSTGSVSSSGLLKLSGTSDLVRGDMTSVGTIESSGTTQIGDLTFADNGHFKLSGGTTHVDRLQAVNAVYTQTDGTFKSDKGWFKDSTLNFEGGRLDAADTRNDDGTVNGTLGHNTVNISGLNTPPSFNNEDSVESKSHFADNLTVVRADTVTSDTVINLMAGGVLDVDHLDLTESGKFNLDGGILRTSLDQIYEWVKTQVIDIKAENPETGVIEIPTQVLASTTVGDVKSSIKDNLTMDSGSIAFDDEFFSASTVLSSALQFAKAFGEDNAVTLHYLGQMQTPVTIDTVKELEDEGLSEVMAGIVLDTTTLHNESAASGTTNRDLIIGGTADGANTINISIGFKDVANADKITVAGGKEFALVGSERAEDFDWTTGYTDATKFLTDAADGGHADAVDGTFTFGSDGLANSTVGWVAASDIAEKGKLLVKNGEFADWTIKNDGTVEVRRNAILHTNDYSGSGEGLNAGTFDVNGTFDVGGTFVNDGFLTAVDTPVTNVIGNLVNTKDGKAEYADMVIAEGGTSANTGNEKGENLTVNGKHTNTGTSIWNTTTVAAGGSWANGGTASGTDMTVAGDYLNVGTAEWTNETVAAGGTAKNTGKETISGTYDVAGSKTNVGEVDATGTETTRVSGSLTNEKDGKSFYDDMVIAAGGSSVNHGYEKGDILTVEGGHTNTGTSIWNTIIAAVGGLFKNDSTLEADDLTVSGSFTNTGDAKLTGETVSAGGSARNEGKETISGTYDVAGDKTNVGEIDATATETTNVSGMLTNETEGNAKYDDMVIAAGGSSVNHGTEIGDILTVKGDHTNTGTSTWNNVGLEDGGHMTNSGTLTTDKLTQNGGVFEHTKGTFTAEDAELNGGDFVIGNHLELSEDNLALAKFPKATEINNRIWVIGNGHAAFGNTADGLGASISAPTLPDTPARVSVSETVTIGSGSLAVGTDTWTSETEKVTLGNGDLYFGSDSYTLVDASNFKATDAAFKSASDTGKLFVKAGASLILGHIPEVGDYLIADGFDTTENGTTDWIGGWNDTTLKALPDSPSGIGWDLKLNHDATKVWVTALYKDVRTVYPDIAIPDNVQDAMNNGGKTGDAADDFIRGTLNNRDLSVGDKTQQINSVAEIGAAGGVMEAFTGDLAAAQNSVFDRVSFTGEHFTREGQLLRDTHGGSLWADILGGQRESSDFTASGNMTNGHKTNAYGVVVGGDYVTAAADKTFGFAVAYSGDTVKSSGDWLATKNKSTSVTATAYADWAVSDKVNLVGTLSYLNGSAKVTQSLLPGFGEAAADVKTNLFSVAARAEYRYRVAGVNVIPHVGLSASFGKSGGYDISVAGEKAFEATPGNVMTFDLPVGVAVRGDYETASGWNLRAAGDLTVTGHFGDREESTDITNGRGVNDTVQAGFLGAWSSNLGLQLQVDKGSATVGLRLGASVGDAGKQDYSGSINVRYVF